MHLYIANASRQVQNFMYRLPEHPQVRQQTIPIGGQIKISGDLTQVEIDAIVKQHEIYGLIPVEDIALKGGFASLCYQVGKPISPVKIEMLAQRNTGVLQDRGREQRKNAAIVMTNQLGASVREHGVELGEVEVDTIEDDNGRSRDRRAVTGDDRIEETTIVTREGRQPGRGGGGRGGNQSGSGRGRGRNRG